MSGATARVIPPSVGGVLPPQFSAPSMFAVVPGATTPVPASGDTHVQNIVGANPAKTSDKSLVAYLIAWGIIIGLLVLFNRSRWGHAIIYYSLVLILMLLLLVNYQAIQALLAPATQGADGVPAQPAGPASNPTTDAAPEVTINVPGIGRISAPRFATAG